MVYLTDMESKKLMLILNAKYNVLLYESVLK